MRDRGRRGSSAAVPALPRRHARARDAPDRPRGRRAPARLPRPRRRRRRRAHRPAPARARAGRRPPAGERACRAAVRLRLGDTVDPPRPARRPRRDGRRRRPARLRRPAAGARPWWRRARGAARAQRPPAPEPALHASRGARRRRRSAGRAGARRARRRLGAHRALVAALGASRAGPGRRRRRRPAQRADPARADGGAHRCARRRRHDVAARVLGRAHVGLPRGMDPRRELRRPLARTPGHARAASAACPRRSSTSCRAGAASVRSAWATAPSASTRATCWARSSS